MAGLQSDTGLMLGQKTRHPAAVLRRAGSIPIQANGISPLRVSLMTSLKTNLVLPWAIEVVLIAEAGAQAEPKLGERDIRRPGRQFQGAEPSCPKYELEQVNALPAHRHLDDTMQFPQGHAGWDLNPTPDHGADAEQPNLELQDFRSWGRIRQPGFEWGALRQVRASRSLVSSGGNLVPPTPYQSAPHILMLSSMP
jgi:hypothetical protein